MVGLVHVSSGNFVAANPYGIVDGVDYGYAGEVRKINAQRVNELLDSGDVVLIGCLGYTSTGEVYNCASEQVALQSAIELGAQKLIFLHEGLELFDQRTGGVVHSLPFKTGERCVSCEGMHLAACIKLTAICSYIKHGAMVPGDAVCGDYVWCVWFGLMGVARVV